jgi:hypothetical protein
MTLTAMRKIKLRFKLLIILLIALGVWRGKISIEAGRQRRIVEWIHTNGGIVRYRASHIDGVPNGVLKELMRMAVEAIGKDYFYTVNMVQLVNTNIRDVGELAGLTNLKSLRLTANEIECIEPLSKLLELKELCIDGNNIQDVSPLFGLRTLLYVELQDNDLDAGDLQSLQQQLPGCQIIRTPPGRRWRDMNRRKNVPRNDNDEKSVAP